MKLIIAFFLFFFFINNIQGQFKWTDKTTKQLWHTLPNNIDECISILDTILSENAKFHFRHTEESVAVIEISRDLVSTFISEWNLREKGFFYDGPNKKFDVWGQVHGLSLNSNISYYFNQYGINDPIEMFRIIFTCYHQKLVNNFFNLNEIVNNYKLYWVKSIFINLDQAPKPNLWRLNPKMEKRDDSVLNKYFFDRVKISDTLTSSFFYTNHRFTSKPLSYTIELIVVDKDSVNTIVRSKIIEISNHKNNPVWYDNKTKRKIGDIIETGYEWDIKREPTYYYR